MKNTNVLAKQYDALEAVRDLAYTYEDMSKEAGKLGMLEAKNGFYKKFIMSLESYDCLVKLYRM